MVLGRMQRGFLGLLCALAVTGCERIERREMLEPLRFAQNAALEVRLDEELLLDFSHALDPTSVYGASVAGSRTPGGTVSLFDSRGRSVAGELIHDGKKLRFRPKIPRTAALDDGSFRPAERYTLELSGFPRVDGLRARDGRPLARTYRFDFATVAIDSNEGLFLDTTLGAPEPLYIESLDLLGHEPIRIRSAEPLDPRSIDATSFQLLSVARQSRIVLRADLVHNDFDGATIELRALESGPGSAPRFLSEGGYNLIQPPGATLPSDLSGQRVSIGWDPTLAILSVAAGAAPTAARGSFTLDFLDANERSPEARDDADGTAYWDANGRVSLRFPRAAGSGRDGDVDLDELAPETRRIEAIDARLGEGSRLELPREGLVVLCAQGRLEIDGTLVRRVLEPPLAREPDESATRWLQRLRTSDASGLPVPDFSADETLSAWLARAESAGLPATVLIAGGDLVIRGRIDLDGPLVLVSGGRVRVPGRIDALDIWDTQPGGGMRVSPEPRPLPLAIDAPTSNPLRRALTVAVSSTSILPELDFGAWGPARVAGSAGRGRYRVQFLGERPRPDASIELIGPVSDPLLLEDAASLRVVIELELDPAPPASSAGVDGARFEPPFVDSVVLTWTRRAP